VSSFASCLDAERSGEWSREEVFRLLQAISMHEDDWESVADHVRTRTKDECCLKFVQLPIEGQRARRRVQADPQV
jgi:hypothetical protein